ELRGEALRVSETRAFVWGKEVCDGRKTVFNLVPVDSALEAALVEFMDEAPDVAAYAKNARKLLTIDYQSAKGHFRLYEPDFVVRLAGGEHWLVEMKGLEDVEVALKDNRARVWCRDATELTAHTATPQHWQYRKIMEGTFYSHRGHSFESLLRHAGI